MYYGKRIAQARDVFIRCIYKGMEKNQKDNGVNMTYESRKNNTFKTRKTTSTPSYSGGCGSSSGGCGSSYSYSGGCGVRHQVVK